MITCYFGCPGCGKTTTLAKVAYKEHKRMLNGKSPYKHIYSNIPIKYCESINVNDLCTFRTPHSLILLDEITLDVDSRDYKTFSNGLKEFFTLHRHDSVDIIYCCQDYSRVDKTIRDCTFDLWYINRSVVPFFRNYSTAKCIYRNININEYSSEMVLGYRFSNLKEAIFSRSIKKINLKKYGFMFNTYDLLQLEDRPIYSSELWDCTFGEKKKPIVLIILSIITFLFVTLFLLLPLIAPT